MGYDFKRLLNEEDEFENEDEDDEELELTTDTVIKAIDEIQDEAESHEEIVLLDLIKHLSTYVPEGDEETLDLITQKLSDYAGIEIPEDEDETEEGDEDEDEEMDEDYWTDPDGEVIEVNESYDENGELLIEKKIKKIIGGKLVVKNIRPGKKRKGFGAVSGKRTSMKIRRAAKKRALKRKNKKMKAKSLRSLRKSLRKRAMKKLKPNKRK